MVSPKPDKTCLLVKNITTIFVIKALAADNNLVQLRFRHDDVR
jgi:hypothetical protein